MEALQAIRFADGKLFVLNQLKLPLVTEYDEVKTIQDGWDAIREMRVRGAPAIAIVAALTLVVELTTRTFSSISEAQLFIKSSLDHLRTSRPTAVNLFKMADEVEALSQETFSSVDDLKSKIVAQLEAMMAEDIRVNKAIGAHGAASILASVTVDTQVKVLTHCNTGSLATAQYGTALGVIRSLFEQKRLEHAFCTETRPYNQGARLTAYELVKEGIPGTLVADSMVSLLMKEKGIHAVVVGADRVVANGDTANKIGTYQIAIAAKHHGVPFFVAAPKTSIDLNKASGSEITIEQRPGAELTHVMGQQLAAPGIGTWNPAFDVTPADLITGIITEDATYFKASGADVFDLAAVLRV